MSRLQAIAAMSLNRVIGALARARRFRFAFIFFTAHSLKVMSDRQLVLDAVEKMPEEFSLRQIVDELLLLDSVKERLVRSERGAPGVLHEDVVKMLDSWITR